MARKTSGSAINRIDEFSVATSMPSVVFDQTTHLYSSISEPYVNVRFDLGSGVRLFFRRAPADRFVPRTDQRRRGHVDTADVDRDRAARVEAAAGRRARRVGHLARQRLRDHVGA